MERCPHCGQTHGPDNHFCGVTGQPLDLGPRLLGQVLLDRFEVRTLVGEGPLAVVLGAVDKSAGNRDVAVKMLHPRYARDAAATERFLAEARRIGELGHPNLVAVHAVGRDLGGAPVVVRDFLTGVCLARYLRGRGTLPVELAAWIANGVAAALRVVHEAGLYDGDLTADDVFLTRGPAGELQVRVLDFGEVHVKRAILTAGLAGPEITRFWAPEQVRSGIVNERSDVFALGAILYQAVVGKAPYPEGIPPAPQVIPIPPNPSAQQPSVNRKLDLIVRRAMALLPTDRYASAAAFAEALAPFVPGQPPPFDWEDKGVVPAPIGLQTAPAAAAPAPAPAAPAAPAKPMHKQTLIGAPALLPPGIGSGPAAHAGPAKATGADATAATMQMPVMPDAAPPGAAPAKAASVPTAAPKKAEPAPATAKAEMVVLEPTTPKKGSGKTIGIIVAIVVVVAIVVGVVYYLQSGEAPASTGDAGAAAKVEAVTAADAGVAALPADAAAPQEAAPAVDDAGAAVDEVRAAPDAAVAEAEPDVVDAAPAPEDVQQVGEAVPVDEGPAEPEDVFEAAPDIVEVEPDVVEAATPEAAAPADVARRRDAAVRDAATREAAARDAAARETTARDAAVREAAVRDAGVRDTGAASRDGRRGLIRDVVF